MSEEMEELTWLEDGRRVSFTLSEDIYPREAILGAAYLFVDRCFVFLERPADKQIEVRLKCKEAPSAEALEQLAGEFANVLLDQVVRFHVSERTGRLREYAAQPSDVSTEHIDSECARLTPSLEKEVIPAEI